jgi:hypothetical protein
MICKTCNKVYEVKDNEIDDECCSFECWESKNSLSPDIPDAFIIDDDDAIAV